MVGKQELYAEVKTKSPFFKIESQYSWEQLFSIACEIGDVVSVHTNPSWGGSFSLIERAATLTNKPILAKGIHETDEEICRAIDAGARWVLVVGRIPNVHQGKCLIEPRSLAELRTIPADYRVAWNSRDLATGGNKAEKFPEARAIRPDDWLCQASNIGCLADIDPSADAVLIGTHLMDIYNEIMAKQKMAHP